MLLFFDTETTGVPRNYRAPITDLDNWPRLVQLGWQLTEDDGRLVQSDDSLVVPEGFTIPEEAVRVHGITTERARREGFPLPAVLEVFAEAAARADLIVAHNFSFDEKILGAEFLRTGLSSPLSPSGAPHLCTMEASTEYCALPGRYGFKWPTLDELHRKLFGRGFDGAHSAQADVTACRECYFELVRLGVIRGL